MENKIPGITGLVTTAALDANLQKLKTKYQILLIQLPKLLKAAQIDNKIPDNSHFINTQGFNRLTKINFDVRLKEACN